MACERYAEWQVVTSTFGDPMKAQVNNSAVNLVIIFKYGKSVKILTKVNISQTLQNCLGERGEKAEETLALNFDAGR
jgi:hypothetical protein